ncbi:MAG: DUF3892 domain-containing protein [Deltaproteobacteria bacterium]|nr:DUF3892 domain-containing protein [Deltaproteobacteria bacterium]
MDIQITCITRSGGSALEHITHVGAKGDKRTVETVIKDIDGRINTFFVRDKANNRADVIVVRPASGRPFIKTKPDATMQDNLLSLPACP